MNTAQLAEHQEFAILQDDGSWLVELDVLCSWPGNHWQVNAAHFRKGGESFGDPGVYEFDGHDDGVGHTLLENFRIEAEDLLAADQVYDVRVCFLDSGTVLNCTRSKFRHTRTREVDC